MTEPVAVDLRIVSPNVSDDEVAAVTAVLQAALEELAASEEASSGVTVSAWQRSQRNLRAPITPGEGRWRSS